MAIKINIQPTTEDLTGQSHWWGFPDLPEALEWPCSNDGELLTFICQIRLEDIAGYDSAGILPHKGMLWFFAELDYFLGDLDAPCEGTGDWSPGTFKVLYSEDCTDLCTHEYFREDGPTEWVGKTLRELSLRATKKINIIGIKQNEEFEITPDPDAPLTEDDILVVIGRNQALSKLAGGLEA